MSHPRAVVPGRTYLLTRRCSERRFFLRPGRKARQAFVYCLAEAANRFGIRVVTVLAMSNHYHAVIMDPLGCYPRFLERFHKMLAKVLNAHWGRWEALWASEQTSMVELVDPADVWRMVLYVLCNPVEAMLVATAATGNVPLDVDHRSGGLVGEMLMRPRVAPRQCGQFVQRS